MRRLGLICFLLLFAATACKHAQPPGYGTPAPGVDLEPPREPILAVSVADSIEAALLEQQLNVVPVRLDGTTLYLYDRGGIGARLADLGYDPQRVNGSQVAQRTVRVSQQGAAPREDLSKFGVSVINRERDHWVVSGSLAALRALTGAGYQLAPVRDPEPRPRQVRVLARSIEDVGRLGGIMDIYSVERADRQQQTKGGPVIVYGAAFDFEIDRIRELGMEVEILPPPPARGGKP